MSTAISVQQPQAIQQWKSPTQIKQRIEAIQQLMSTVLKKDTDFGIIPGMPKGTKPSLWKPGSEQILAMFQIAVDPVVEDLSTDDCYRYRVTTRLTNVQTGEFLGAGIGEASTDETKYKWKKCWSKAEFDATDPDRRRMKFSTYDGNTKEEMQVRQEPADLANTILKMAKKRSQIDATLTVTGASSMFEQDLEDLPEETRAEMARQRGVKKQQSAAVGDVLCNECRAVNGHLPSCPHRKQAPAAATVPQGTTSQPQAAQSTPEPSTGFVKLAVKVEALNTRKSKPFRTLSVVSDDGTKMISCWHDSLLPILDGYMDQPPVMAVLEVSKKEKDGKTWCSLEHVLELDGVPFVNDQPADQEELS